MSTDAFNRADGPPGTSDSGDTWTVFHDTVVIEDGRLKCVGSGGDADTLLSFPAVGSPMTGTFDFEAETSGNTNSFFLFGGAQIEFASSPSAGIVVQSAGSGGQPQTHLPFTVIPGIVYTVRVLYTTGDAFTPDNIKVKIWSGTEPAAWMVDHDDDTPGGSFLDTLFGVLVKNGNGALYVDNLDIDGAQQPRNCGGCPPFVAGITDTWEREIAFDSGWGISDYGLPWVGTSGLGVSGGLGLIHAQNIPLGDTNDFGGPTDLPRDGLQDEVEALFAFTTPTFDEPIHPPESVSDTSTRILVLTLGLPSIAGNGATFTFVLKRFHASPPPPAGAQEHPTDSLLRARFDNNDSASGSTWEEGTYEFHRFLAETKYHARCLMNRSEAKLRYWMDGFPEPGTWSITSKGVGINPQWMSEDGVNGVDDIPPSVDPINEDSGFLAVLFTYVGQWSYVTLSPTTNHPGVFDEPVALDNLSVWLDGALLSGGNPPMKNQPVQDELVAIGDGETTEYATDWPYRAASLQVQVAGMLADVDPSDPATGDFELTDPAPAGARIEATYRARGT